MQVRFMKHYTVKNVTEPGRKLLPRKLIPILPVTENLETEIELTFEGRIYFKDFRILKNI